MDTAPLDGLRAILNIWILVFHVAYCLMHFLPEGEVKAVFEQSGERLRGMA